MHRAARQGRPGHAQRLNPDTFRWANVGAVRVSPRGRATVKVSKAGTYRVEIRATKTMAAGDSPSLRYR